MSIKCIARIGHEFYCRQWFLTEKEAVTGQLLNETLHCIFLELAVFSQKCKVKCANCKQHDMITLFPSYTIQGDIDTGFILKLGPDYIPELHCIVCERKTRELELLITK